MISLFYCMLDIAVSRVQCRSVGQRNEVKTLSLQLIKALNLKKKTEP